MEFPLPHLDQGIVGGLIALNLFFIKGLVNELKKNSGKLDEIQSRISIWEKQIDHIQEKMTLLFRQVDEISGLKKDVAVLQVITNQREYLERTTHGQRNCDS